MQARVFDIALHSGHTLEVQMYAADSGSIIVTGRALGHHWSATISPNTSSIGGAKHWIEPSAPPVVGSDAWEEARSEFARAVLRKTIEASFTFAPA